MKNPQGLQSFQRPKNPKSLLIFSIKHDCLSKFEKSTESIMIQSGIFVAHRQKLDDSEKLIHPQKFRHKRQNLLQK